MKTALFSILKNLVLLLILGVILVFIFSIYIVKQEFLICFAAGSLLYILACILEAHSHKALITSGSTVFMYHTASAVAKYVIKIAVYVVIGVVFLVSGNNMKYMAWLCFMVAGAEVVIMLYKHFTKGYYISLSDEKLVVSTTKPEVAFISGIKQINTRHGLVYILKHDLKAITIRVDIMPDKEAFMQKLTSWAADHQIPFISEP
ncbi:MAG: hypothetical protein JST26_10420 [Bacteroidetes bacterium]|nr:hypothetical protein [Bacteroidota bacterium]